jgi:hypothetical protein
VVFDPATGVITSIRDKQRDLELVDQSAPHHFNEYLYERFETSDWAAPTTWHRVQAATLKASSGPVAQIMQVTAKPVGVETMTQTVILYADLPRIDFALDMVKAPTGRSGAQPPSSPLGKESLYVALPLAVSQPQVRHELPGCVSEPVKDIFDGANTAFYPVRHFSDVSNDRFGVTISALDSALFEYDRPRCVPIAYGHESEIERDRRPITTGRVYLYLMNNMFDVNIRWDQAGPAHFAYSLRSHDGDWQKGQADQFGWDTMNPLLAREVRGKHAGQLPATASFISIDQPNVVCTTLKPAEANGAGFILRFVETQGRPTKVNVSMPLLAPIASVTQTNLVEDDRPEQLRVDGDTRVTLDLPPFAVRTIRVIHQSPTFAAVTGLAAQALADMQVELKWAVPFPAEMVSHYHVYRGTKPDFKPGLLNLVQRPAANACTDQPQAYLTGWINNRLEPATTYYYRVAPVDRWNHEGPACPAVAVTTLKSSEKNLPPLAVQGLSAVPVSPIASYNAINLIWRTNCESDIRAYEVHRSTTAAFAPTAATRLGEVDALEILKGRTEYGSTPVDHRLNEYDHQMYFDTTVLPVTTYYYRVCAVDTAGQKGPFSDTVEASTHAPRLLDVLARGLTAQSIYAPEFGADLAIDGINDPFFTWVSKPYGGGSKDHPQDVWWAFEFPGSQRLKLAGVRIMGDHRDVIPLQRNLQVQTRIQGDWKTLASVTGAAEKDLTVRWPEPVETDAIRVFVPAGDLPKSDRPDVDGIVRISELLFILPDGREVAPLAVFATAPH